ncbi:MAG: hypothetical protein OP8BY_0135 [Candidatus Saccharicenans subterraneus]|uniref:Porin n=1 Tax=Candidatus Saccharicenans subterraneus TaxID=2508984 RepID=A0A3E2BIU0_9BACT|nr:MAG: hypothetical protein OP8BY_0135 [Candidatus Saccharicenans subterraneum]
MIYRQKPLLPSSFPRKNRLFISPAWLLVMLFLAIRAATGEVRPAIHGEIFSEYYIVCSHSNSIFQGNHGFWFRRINLYYDQVVSPSLFFRFRIETSSAGDFSSDALLVPFIKDAFLGWTVLGQRVQIGLIPTPTWESLEPFWQYRVLEKTPCDLQKMGSARDLGISLSGPLNKAGTISYKLMFGNGEGYKSESNRGKKLYAQFTIRPSKVIWIDIYTDSERDRQANHLGLYQVFVGLQGRPGRLGLFYAYRQQHSALENNAWHLVSTFVICRLLPRLDLITRFDWLSKPNPSGPEIPYLPISDSAAPNLVIAGLGWEVSPSVVVIPNLKHVFYGRSDSGSRPNPDTYFNLSLKIVL